MPVSTLFIERRSPLHQSVDCVHPAIALSFGGGLSGFGRDERNECGSEFGSLDEHGQLRDVRSVVGCKRSDITMKKLKPVMAVNSAMPGFACACNADPIVVPLCLNVVGITLRSVHSKTQHKHTLPFTLAKIDYPNYNADQAEDHQHHNLSEDSHRAVERFVDCGPGPARQKDFDCTLHQQNNDPQNHSGDDSINQNHRPLLFVPTEWTAGIVS
jgi:hypothetical protein